MKIHDLGFAILAAVLAWLVFILLALTLAFPPPAHDFTLADWCGKEFIAQEATETGYIYYCTNDYGDD